MIKRKADGSSGDRTRRYVPAVGPRLKKLLFVVFGLFALLVVNAVYLASISLLEWWTSRVYQNWFYLIMFLVHLVVGLILVVPFLVYGFAHLRNTYNRANRRAVWAGYGLFFTALLLLASGILLTRVEIGGILLRIDPGVRPYLYWTHVLTPLFVVWLFVLHRLAGRRIRWRVGASWAAVAAAFALFMLILQFQDPRRWDVEGNPKGATYFDPSLARTVSGNFIPARVLDNNGYCVECHADIHRNWSHSAHRFASFNNPAYFASVRETRSVIFERDKNVQAARFCAGCHDPVPFFSGEFDKPRFDSPDYDLSSDPMASAGITCTVCHSISHINSPRGNADYTIDEPIHYPFAFSQNRLLRWTNRQLIKAKPEFHRKTFLKPLHQSIDFCGTCHKVHIPVELNHYKWLRGQNHQDAFWLSGVSGFGAASFYYPEKAETNCNGCHMPLLVSSDFGARRRDDSGLLKVHNHQFPSANTALPQLLGMPEWVNAEHRRFLEGSLRVDIFGVREEGRIDGPLVAPLRPDIPTLVAGKSYLIETVLRTLKMGHTFTQGTADSNEVWLDVKVTSGGRLIGRSGAESSDGTVDPWSHFVNAYVLDRFGKRIDRRNVQDIFVPLYDHQIPPGAADVIHYLLALPAGLTEPVTVEVQLKYRKFDTGFTRFFQKDKFTGNHLPVTVIAADRVTFPLATAQAPTQESAIPEWMRWNDYGIGLLLRGQLRQAEESFRKVEELGRPDGPLNLARVYLAEGLVQELAPDALGRARSLTNPPAAPWTLLWLAGLVNEQNGNYAEAVANFSELVRGGFAEAQGRGFDFSRDYRVLNELGQATHQQALQIRSRDHDEERTELLKQSVGWYNQALVYDPENLTAHYGLKQVYRILGDREKEAEHETLHARYKPDDNARDFAVGIARRNDPAADQASERLVIYDLRQPESLRLADQNSGEQKQK